MSRRTRPLRAVFSSAALGLLFALLAAPSPAIIVLGGRDANGVLNNSGTNRSPDPFDLRRYVGLLGGTLGAPISPKYFVTATHVGNGGSNATSGLGAFDFANGTSTVTRYNVERVATSSDLAVWRISDAAEFSLFAPVYTRADEVGQPLVTFGNGAGRGAEVLVNGEVRGWRWSGQGARPSWGTNDVSTVFNLTPEEAGQPLAGFVGEFLYSTFDRRLDAQGNLLNPDEGIFANGDSGGVTFVQDPTDGRYKVAGVNSLVDTASLTPNGANAGAIFDARGLYSGDDLITGDSPVPLGSYATRISSRVEFLQNATGVTFVPAPGSSAIFVGALAVGGLALRRRTRARSRAVGGVPKN